MTKRAASERISAQEIAEVTLSVNILSHMLFGGLNDYLRQMNARGAFGREIDPQRMAQVLNKSDERLNRRLVSAIDRARKAGVPETTISRIIPDPLG